MNKAKDIIQEKWYARWFDENYLQLYGHRNLKDAKKQIDLLLKVLSPDPNKKILDLGCGSGRHCVLLKEYGYTVVGMDLSPVLLSRARQSDPDLMLIRGDKRHIPGFFDVILSLFTSFGYFDTDKEHMDTLAEIYNSLTPGGYFWLDFLNSEYVKNHLQEESVRELPDGTIVRENRWIDQHFVYKRITFVMEDFEKHYIERVRLYSRDDLRRMLREIGFTVLHEFGNYEGKSWEESDERTILVAKKEH